MSEKFEHVWLGKPMVLFLLYNVYKWLNIAIFDG